MQRKTFGIICAALTASSVLTGALPATAQKSKWRWFGDPQVMEPLNWMKGRWEGEAWFDDGTGKHHKLFRMERVGPLLGGSIIVIEGASFEMNGAPAAFNDFNIISWDEPTFRIRSYAYGAGWDANNRLETTPTGYVWKSVAGPTTFRYIGTHSGDQWREVCEEIDSTGRVTIRFEMNLHRVGETDWPAAGLSMPKQVP